VSQSLNNQVAANVKAQEMGYRRDQKAFAKRGWKKWTKYGISHRGMLGLYKNYPHSLALIGFRTKNINFFMMKDKKIIEVSTDYLHCDFLINFIIKINSENCYNVNI